MPHGEGEQFYNEDDKGVGVSVYCFLICLYLSIHYFILTVLESSLPSLVTNHRRAWTTECGCVSPPSLWSFVAGLQGFLIRYFFYAASLQSKQTWANRFSVLGCCIEFLVGPVEVMLETDTEDPEIMKDLVTMMRGDQPSLDEKGPLCGMGYLCEAFSRALQLQHYQIHAQ